MSPRPPAVALILPSVQEYSRAVKEGVIEASPARSPWMLIDLPHETIGRTRSSLAKANLQGAIVWAERRDAWVNDLVARGVRVVNCGSDWRGVPGVATVRAEQENVFAALIRHIGDLALPRVWVIGHQIDRRPVMRAILEEFCTLARAADLQAELWQLGGADNPEDDPQRVLLAENEARLAEFLRALPAPSALFCENDHIAALVCRVAGLVGRRVPEELAVAGFGNSLVARFSEPPVTSVAVPGSAVGQAAARCLQEWLERGRPPAAETLVPGATLAIRESTVGRSGSVAMERVRRHVALHAARGQTLGELAQLAELSPKTLVRRYTEAFGLEPLEDVRRRRVEEIRRLLRETKRPLADVAAACGFSSPANFYNFVLRHTGSIPSALRTGTGARGKPKQ